MSPNRVKLKLMHCRNIFLVNKTLLKIVGVNFQSISRKPVTGCYGVFRTNCAFYKTSLFRSGGTYNFCSNVISLVMVHL